MTNDDHCQEDYQPYQRVNSEDRLEDDKDHERDPKLEINKMFMNA